jgi:hypothetical protein
MTSRENREVTAMAHVEVTAKAPKSKPFNESVKKLDTGKKRRKTDLRGSLSGESSDEDEAQQPKTSTQSSQRDKRVEPRPGTSKQSTKEDETEDDEEWTLPKWKTVDIDSVDIEVETMMEEGSNEEAIKRIKELLLTPGNKEEKKYLKDKLKEAYKCVRQKARNDIPKLTLTRQNQ